jgi:hypothetical protein
MHTTPKILGAFDNGPMSSVNNIRNIKCSNIIEISCIQFEKILRIN